MICVCFVFQFIDKLYEEELTDFEGEMADRLKKHQDQAKEIVRLSNQQDFLIVNIKRGKCSS